MYLWLCVCVFVCVYAQIYGITYGNTEHWKLSLYGTCVVHACMHHHHRRHHHIARFIFAAVFFLLSRCSSISLRMRAILSHSLNDFTAITTTAEWRPHICVNDTWSFGYFWLLAIIASMRVYVYAAVCCLVHRRLNSKPQRRCVAVGRCWRRGQVVRFARRGMAFKKEHACARTFT